MQKIAPNMECWYIRLHWWHIINYQATSYALSADV